MKYKSAGAFRAALETRLRRQSLESNVPLDSLRKTVAFDRLIARLVEEESERWVIKGGLALQIRLGTVARTTRDVDATTVRKLTRAQAINRLQKAAALDLGDYFEFEIGEPTVAATGAPEGGLRFPVRCLLDGGLFEGFQLDLGQGDPLTDKPETLTTPALLEFAGIPPARVPCYPLTTQIAEKVHAYTRPYAAGETSRVRDLTDLLLIGSIGTLKRRRLTHALVATFEARATHELPKRLPKPPSAWSGPYKKLAGELKLSWSTLEDAWDATSRFISPVLDGTAEDDWDPIGWRWK
jgi:hypothetical protein